MNNNVIF